MKLLNDARKLFKHKGYRNMLIAKVISRFGDSIDVVAFSWLVYELTGSAVLLGAIYIINILPNLILSPFVGPIVNYFSAKKLMVIGDLARFSLVACVATLYFLGVLVPWHLFVFTVLTSTIEVFVVTAKTSIYQLTIPSDEYVSANSLGSTITQFASLLGFAFAGGIIAALGIEAAMYIDAFTFLCSGIIIVATRLPLREIEAYSKKSYKDQLKKGYNYLIKDHTLMSILFLCLLANFLITPLNALMPVYVKEALKANASAMAMISIMFTVGGILGGLVINRFGQKVSPYVCIIIPITLVGILVSSLSLPLFINWVPATLIASLSFFLIGLMLPFTNIMLNTYIMKRVPNKFIGHVGGMVSTIVMIANPISAGLFGFISDQINIGYICIGIGSLLAITTLIFSRFNALLSLKKYESINELPVIEESAA